MGAYDFLQRLNLDIIGVWSEKRKEKIPDEIYSWSGDYIFSFQSYFVVPKKYWIEQKFQLIFIQHLQIILVVVDLLGQYMMKQSIMDVLLTL